MAAWSHLANAALINWVLHDIRKHPDRWAAARDAARDDVREAARAAAWAAAWDTARDTAQEAVWEAVWDAVWEAVRGAARGAARDAARDSVAALVAWDDCQEVLDLPMDAFKFFVEVQDPRAVLLYPLKHIKETS